MSETREELTTWGTHSLGVDQTYKWEIGPCSLWLARKKGEIRVTYKSSDDPFALTSGFEPDAVEPEDGKTTRFVDEAPTAPLSVVPALADRAIVVRLADLLVLMPGQSVQLFVGSQVWVQVRNGKQLLYEAPTFELSQTWFGADTRSGELCYASRTQAYLSTDDLLVRPARALTALTIRNQASSALEVVRVKVPLGHLDLYQDQSGRLWTQNIRARWTDDNDELTTEVGDEPRGEGKMTRIAEPRLATTRLRRALGLLAGGR